MKQGFGTIRNHKLLHLLLGCLLLAFLLPATRIQAKSTFTWDEAYALIEAKFPNVPTIDMLTFQKWRKEDPHLLLIDVRKEKEFAVSRIPGAVLANRLGKLKALVKESNRKAVLYCSVGYRSAKLVQKLKAKGFNQVYNLKGSIFDWANQGDSLVNDKGETPHVHPFNDRWGQLLDAGHHPPE